MGVSVNTCSQVVIKTHICSTDPLLMSICLKRFLYYLIHLTRAIFPSSLSIIVGEFFEYKFCLFDMYQFGHQTHFWSHPSVCPDYFSIQSKISFYIYLKLVFLAANKNTEPTYTFFYLTADSASTYIMAHSATLFSLRLPSLVSLTTYSILEGTTNRCFPLCFDYHELHKKLLLTSQI